MRTNPSPKSSNEGTSIETCICSGRREGPYAKLRSQKVKKGPLLRLEFVIEGGRPKRRGSGGVESLGGYLVMAYITGGRAF